MFVAISLSGVRHHCSGRFIESVCGLTGVVAISVVRKSAASHGGFHGVEHVVVSGYLFPDAVGERAFQTSRPAKKPGPVGKKTRQQLPSVDCAPTVACAKHLVTAVSEVQNFDVVASGGLRTRL